MNEQRSLGQRLWWLQPDFALGWSSEEQWTRGTIWAIAVVLWVVPLWSTTEIGADLGLGRRVGAAIGLFAFLPPAMWIARVIAVRMWPETVRQADENAARRIEAENSTRS